MAYPTVKARTETPDTTASTTVAFDFATGAAKGDLVVAFIGLNDTAQAITTTESFTNWTNASATFHVVYKILDGTEGTSSAVTVPVASRAAIIAYTITAGTFASTIVPAISTVATGTSTAPNATSCAPTGSAKDYLWISAFRQNGEEADDDTWCTAAPSTPGTFTNLVQVTTGTAGAATGHGSVAAAEYQANTTSVDAGAFTVAQSLAWRAYTIAIYPIQSDSLTANAAIKKAITGSFTADAIRSRTYTGSFIADAICLQTYSGSFTANADLVAGAQTQTGSFSADAVHLRSSGTISVPANAVFLRGATQTISSDATKLKIESGSIVADAVQFKTIYSSVTADAIRQLTQTGQFSIDAIRHEIRAFGLPADAIVKGDVSVVTDSITADAIKTLVGACIWTYPNDGDPITATPEMRFLMPYAVHELYFWLEMDKVDTFDSANLRQYKTTDDLAGWSYWDGGTWQSVPAGGVANTYAGNEARLIVSDPLMGGTWYRRVRAGTR